MELARAALVGAKAELRDSQRAHAEIGRRVLEDLLADAALAAQRVAHRVGVEHVFHSSKGSRAAFNGVCSGRSIVSFHAPRQEENVSGQVSAGSRMIRRPSRRAMTTTPSG